MRSRVFCSQTARRKGVRPTGTAPGKYDRYIVIEAEPPWRPEVSESPSFLPQLARLLSVAAEDERRVRLQCVLRDAEYSHDGYARVMHFSRPQGAFARFERLEYAVPQHKLVGVVTALLESGDLEPFTPYLEPNREVRDLLVCTHGARDACCCKFGYPIYAHLRKVFAGRSSGRLRVWRSSHLGGHRNAPTMLDLPGARYWGHVTPAAAELIAGRCDHPEAAIACYRGWAGLRTPFEQALEGAVLAAEGWSWMDRPLSRSYVEMDARQRSARVRLEYLAKGGSAAVAYEGLVSIDETVLTPLSCGDEPEEAPVYSVKEFQSS